MHESRSNGQKIYFKGLDEIRAIAALSVMFHHIELYKFRAGISSLFDTPLAPALAALGEHGVYSFFVMSGFLITYLLLTEKKQFAIIQLRKFYIRRVLRIWPLYYFIIILSFLVVPLVAPRVNFLQNETYYFEKNTRLREAFVTTLGLFLLFLPNLALKLRPPVVGAAQSWSVGVEEQFYLIWPLIVQRVPNRLMAWVFAIIAIVYPLVPTLLHKVSAQLASYCEVFVLALPIHIMAIGAFGATILFRNPQCLKTVLGNEVVFGITICMLAVALMIRIPAFMFACIVMAVIAFCIQDGLRFNLRSAMLRALGKVSYGVYMYHSLVMYVVFGAIHTESSIYIGGVLYQVTVYAAVLCGTLLVSQLSYTFLELPFISLKNRVYTVVQSGEDTQFKTEQ